MKLRIPRGKCENCAEIKQIRPQGLDSSGLSPLLLKRLLDASVRLPYREALAHLECWGVSLSLNKSERIVTAYGNVFTEKSWETLAALSKQSLEHSNQDSRVITVQIDGCMVMEKDKPEAGCFEGRELKQVCIYPEQRPSQACNFATAKPKAEFSEAVQGILRQVAKQEDLLIGLADGARWIDELFEELAVKVRILDVYHAAEYLEKVMLALDYDQQQREAQRASWYRGDVNARVWLKHHLPHPMLIQTWSIEAQDALVYLQNRLDQMNYADFRQKGYPIGSGKIEGLNKSLIAARMKRGGMFWSHQGLNSMAALRSAQFTHIPLAHFTTSRLQAFNPL